MLVSGGPGVMRMEVLYGVSRIARVVRFCCVRCCLFQAAFRSVVSLFPPFPSLPHWWIWVSIGLVSISTDWVSVTVPGGWLPLAELPWMPVCPAQGSWLKARCSPQNHRPL